MILVYIQYFTTGKVDFKCICESQDDADMYIATHKSNKGFFKSKEVPKYIKGETL